MEHKVQGMTPRITPGSQYHDARVRDTQWIFNFGCVECRVRKYSRRHNQEMIENAVYVTRDRSTHERNFLEMSKRMIHQS